MTTYSGDIAVDTPWKGEMFRGQPVFTVSNTSFFHNLKNNRYRSFSQHPDIKDHIAKTKCRNFWVKNKSSGELYNSQAKIKF